MPNWNGFGQHRCKQCGAGSWKTTNGPAGWHESLCHHRTPSHEHDPPSERSEDGGEAEEEDHKLPFFFYDIAIVTIKAVSKDILPICLPAKNVLHSIKNLKFDQEITIVGIGKRNKDDNNHKNWKLQYGKVERIDEKQCYQRWFPKKLVPNKFYEIENRGLCVKGIKKEIKGCNGDSGSPAIWKHNNKDYLIGIHFEDDDDCKIPKNKPVKQSKYVAVPGVLFKWIKEKGGKEIENVLKKC